jgi:hypothetical protein
MGFEAFVEQYKPLLGGVFIAIATLIAVLLSNNTTRKNVRQSRRRAHASFASAIAAELADNAQNLMDLYIEIAHSKSKSHRITAYKNFHLQVYETLLNQIGDLGPSLSYTLVDICSDIRKIRSSLEGLTNKEIIAAKTEILPDIQAVMVKTIACSFVLMYYADYLNGRRFVEQVHPQRLLWAENLLEQFGHYVAIIDDNADFVTVEEERALGLTRRFERSKDRKLVAELIAVLRLIPSLTHRNRARETQMLLNLVSYKIKNTLMYFLEIQPTDYDLAMENLFKATWHKRGFFALTARTSK